MGSGPVRPAPAGAQGVLGIGSPAPLGGPLLANGCSTPVDFSAPHALVFFRASASGTWQGTTVVPNDTNLIGLSLASQAAVVSASTGPPRLDLSNSLYLTLGR